ncbi:MAG: hypothetical protein NXI10_07940 [bacterium]|nr:hypothetical protein [bacterium]
MAFSCSKKPESGVEFKGVDINPSSVFVDAVSLDSLSFASGEKRWLLKGLIVNNGIEYSYSMVYGQNPFESDVIPLMANAPMLIESNDSTVVVLTHHEKNVMISWRTEDQFVCVKSVLTSER